jgi:hypothetical protein
LEIKHRKLEEATEMNSQANNPTSDADYAEELARVDPLSSSNPLPNQE